MSMPSEGPWKVKERKRKSSGTRKQPHYAISVERSNPNNQDLMSSKQIPRQRASSYPMGKRSVPSRSRRRIRSAVLISVGIVAITSVLVESNHWPEQLAPSNVLSIAKAQNFSLLDSRGTGEIYQLQLGSYQEEIGARYAWTAYQASLGGPLDDWEPQFERTQNGGNPSHQILAGSFVSLDEANHFCTHMQLRSVPCKPIAFR